MWSKGENNEWSLTMSQYSNGTENRNYPRMLSDIESLQQEPERADLKLRNLLVAPIDRESEIGIKLLESSVSSCVFGWGAVYVSCMGKAHVTIS